MGLQNIKRKKSNGNMRIWKSAGIVAVLCIVVLSVELVYFRSSQLTEFFSRNPFLKAKSYDVGIVLGESKKTGLINIKGGKIESDEYKLDFPENSLLGSAEVSIEKIFDLKSLPKGNRFVAGIHITSDDEALGNPAELEIKIPKEFAGKKIAGFAYNEDGRAFHYYPVQIKGDSAVFRVYHFSGYGLVSVDDKYDSPPDPNDIRNRAEQVIRNILGEGVSEENLSGLSDDQRQRIKNILDLWYRVKVKPLIDNAKRDEALVMKAAKEFVIWWQATQALPDMENIFGVQIQEAKVGLSQGVNNAVEKAVKKCNQEKDPAQAGVLIKLSALAHYLALQGIQGVDSESIKEKALKCANFEVKMTGNFSEHMVAIGPLGSVNIDIKYEESGFVSLTIDDDFGLSGEGTAKIDSYSESRFTCVQNPPEMNTIKVPKLKFESSGKAGVTLLFDTGESTGVVWTCRDANGVTSTDPNSVWDYGFYEMHKDEYQGAATGYLFKLVDWEILGKGGVYAKKEYNRTKTFSVANNTRTVTEHTLFELIHKPR